jgi:hypothetical protein
VAYQYVHTKQSIDQYVQVLDEATPVIVGLAVRCEESQVNRRCESCYQCNAHYQYGPLQQHPAIVAIAAAVVVAVTAAATGVSNQAGAASSCSSSGSLVIVS